VPRTMRGAHLLRPATPLRTATPDGVCALYPARRAGHQSVAQQRTGPSFQPAPGAPVEPSERTMPYCPIIGTLGYVLSPDGQQVLMIHRNARPDDQHLGKYNGLGGKLEADEDVVAGMRREIME